MKKIKSLFAVVILAAFTSSCTKEEALTTNEVQNQSVMRFASEKEMNDKIAEIEAFKKNQEDQILQKILVRNNLSAPTLQDVKNASKKELTEADKAKVLEDVKFYHQEKLKAIYAERAHFGFTSIQSIADEINYNKLLNPIKAEELAKSHSEFLISSFYLIKPRFSSPKNLILNSESSVFINNKLLDFKNENSSLNRITIPKEGVLASNGIYAVTWHAGVDGSNRPFTQFASFVNGALFHSWYYPTSNSYAAFWNGTGYTLSFPTSAGPIVRNQVTAAGASNVGGGFVSATVSTIINGQYATISGSQNF